MAKIPTFQALAPDRPSLAPMGNDPWGAALANVADSSARLADQLIRRAAQLRPGEGVQDATGPAMATSMPGLDFAFKPGPGNALAMTRSMPGNIRKMISDAALRHGVDPNALLTTAMLESSGNPNAANPGSSARGLFQFTAATAQRYGLTNPLDPAASADAAARLMADNTAYLTKTLGRAPTAAELYLAHQQGAGGAAKLLANPSASAASIVGADAVRLNGGSPDMTAGEFAAMWLKKAGGNGQLTITPSGQAGPLPQVPGHTLYADAYNKAAADIYLNRLDTAMRTSMGAVALQAPDASPAQLSASLDALKSGFLSEDLPAPARAQAEMSFEREKAGLVSQSIAAWQKKQQNELTASFQDRITAETTSAMRIASGVPSNAVLDGALGQLNSTIDASPLTPEQKQKQKHDIAQQVYAARVVAGMGQVAPADRPAYLKQFTTEGQSGDGFGARLDAETFAKTEKALQKQIATDQAAAQKQATAVGKAIDTQVEFLKKGYPVSDAARQQIGQAVAATGDPALADRQSFLDTMASVQSAAAAGTLPELDAQIGALQQRIDSQGATTRAVDALDILTTLRKNMGKALATDPLSWASDHGVIAVAPLDFSSSDTLIGSLATRRTEASAVAQHYGVPEKFFTPAETDALKKALDADPTQLPQIVSALDKGLGADLGTALGEVSKSAPLLAHAAGLYAATGDQGPLVEAGEALAMRKLPGYKSPLPPAGQLASAARDALGGALAVDPQAETDTTEMAAALLERRAQQRNIGLDKFSDPNSPGRALFEDALNTALGGTQRNGVSYGGLTEVNGVKTVAPPDMPTDRLGTLLENLTPDDLIFQQSIVSANGVPVTAARIRAGHLVAAGNGRYRVALGDPLSADPQYVRSADGGFFTLDAEMLARTEAGRGAAPAHGFGPNAFGLYN